MRGLGRGRGRGRGRGTIRESGISNTFITLSIILSWMIQASLVCNIFTFLLLNISCLLFRLLVLLESALIGPPLMRRRRRELATIAIDQVPVLTIKTE